jgi:hypothetical protein
VSFSRYAIASNSPYSVGKRTLRGALDELFRAPSVLDEVGDCDHLQRVPLAVRDQILDARHRPVFVHDLADDACGRQACKPREVHRGLGLPRALEDAAGLRAEREHVAGLHEVLVLRGRMDRHLDRARAIVREMPVVTPSRASIETVKAVPSGVSLCSVIG